MQATIGELMLLIERKLREQPESLAKGMRLKLLSRLRRELGDADKLKISLPSKSKDSPRIVQAQPKIVEPVTVLTDPDRDYEDMTNDELRNLLDKRGLPKYGNKEELVLRLRDDDRPDAGDGFWEELKAPSGEEEDAADVSAIDETDWSS